MSGKQLRKRNTLMPSHIRISWRHRNFPEFESKGGGLEEVHYLKFFDSPPGDQRVAPVDPAERCSAKAKEPLTPRFGNAPWFGKDGDHGDASWNGAEAEAYELVRAPW